MKIIYTIILCSITLLAHGLGSTPLSVESISQKYSGDLYGYKRFLAEFEYKSDKESVSMGYPIKQTPTQTLNYKSGDCDDFSRLHMRVLRGWAGYKPRRLIICDGSKEAHDIVVFRWKGELLYFDNNMIKKPYSKTLGGLLNNNFPDATSVMELDKYGKYSRLGKL